MDPRKLFFDERFKCQCVYCGGIPSTKDHVPSKVMLDEPYPANLPVVPACKECNNGFSADEKYFACFVECVITGSVGNASIKRDKVKRILSEDTALASLIVASLKIDSVGNVYWVADSKRVKNVILKLARGHVAYELNEPQLQEPEYISCSPIVEMSEEQFKSFNTVPIEGSLPELGSRAFLRTVVVSKNVFTYENDWLTVQEGRYRYSVSWSDRINVRMVLSEYLACEVIW